MGPGQTRLAERWTKRLASGRACCGWAWDSRRETTTRRIGGGGLGGGVGAFKIPLRVERVLEFRLIVSAGVFPGRFNAVDGVTFVVLLVVLMATAAVRLTLVVALLVLRTFLGSAYITG